MLAAKGGREEVVRFRLSKGVNVPQKDNVSDINHINYFIMQQLTTQ